MVESSLFFLPVVTFLSVQRSAQHFRVYEEDGLGCREDEAIWTLKDTCIQECKDSGWWKYARAVKRK